MMRSKLHYKLVLTLQYIVQKLVAPQSRRRLRTLMATSSARKKRSADLLSVGQAAEILSVHPDTLRRWAAGGLVRVYRVGPRRDRRFHRSEIVQLMTPG